jgi:Kef-type K+ transport system membrane component KefB
MRVVAFTILTPFYFLKAGSLVDFRALVAGAALIAILLALKMATKFVGILPLTKVFRFDHREGMYTTLLMSTGLTFGTICVLYGLANGMIDQLQYTILVTAACQCRLKIPRKCRAKNPWLAVSVISRRVDRGSCSWVACGGGVVPAEVVG